MLRSFIYIGIGGWLLLLGMLGLIALAISCMIRGDKLRFPGLFLSFILLAFLSLDGGLLTFYSMLSDTAGWMGKTWPASSVTNTCCAAAPLVLAVACGAWALWGLAKARFPLQLTVPISMVMVVAVWQGLTRLGWVSVRQVIGLFTGLPLHEPWITIRDIGPRTLVVVAIIFVLWTPPLRSTDGKAGTGGFPILSDPHSKRWHPDASAHDDRSSNASDG